MLCNVETVYETKVSKFVEEIQQLPQCFLALSYACFYYVKIYWQYYLFEHSSSCFAIRQELIWCGCCIAGFRGQKTWNRHIVYSGARYSISSCWLNEHAEHLNKMACLSIFITPFRYNNIQWVVGIVWLLAKYSDITKQLGLFNCLWEVEHKMWRSRCSVTGKYHLQAKGCICPLQRYLWGKKISLWILGYHIFSSLLNYFLGMSLHNGKSQAISTGIELLKVIQLISAIYNDIKKD